VVQLSMAQVQTKGPTRDHQLHVSALAHLQNAQKLELAWQHVHQIYLFLISVAGSAHLQVDLRQVLRRLSGQLWHYSQPFQKTSGFELPISKPAHGTSAPSSSLENQML
jgi:hypothetical protein